MRILTAVNVTFWLVLFVAWIPYTALMGFGDPVSAEVRLILAVTAMLLSVQALLRIRRRRLAPG